MFFVAGRFENPLVIPKEVHQDLDKSREFRKSLSDLQTKSIRIPKIRIFGQKWPFFGKIGQKTVLVEAAMVKFF